MKYDRVDVIIIGAGVVGLAVASELAAGQPNCSIVFMDKNDNFGKETSSRNSEVIHAGIYYPAESLKAELCVEGKHLLYEFCKKWSIPHHRCGKIIVASSEKEVDSLQRLLEQAQANGVMDLEELNPAKLSIVEPCIRARKALFSPSTGIINSYALMRCLEQIALNNGAIPAYCHLLTAIEALKDGYRVYFTNPDGSHDALECCYLINSAGLHAGSIAALAGIDPAENKYRIHLCKGEYFSLPAVKAARVNHLIYPPPLPELEGLGIHITKTLDGRLRLGPNAVYVEKEDYSVDQAHALEFYRAAKKILPLIELEDLEPEMAGIRPKLSGRGEGFRDFVICEESPKGRPGLINLVGIESPGLTASLAIAKRVSAIIGKL